ncbi:hypothetical protein EBAPG3_012115 [Nitrosospira lacus]|uniref:Uncharacterized protein n=1 Tax=Nitrosospira lacus TaxID=1288494 RepID=A0A1W6SRR5_9PROT|nr:hypothetical protein EBAPG3_012115 [Nitrosospira lacus]
MLRFLKIFAAALSFVSLGALAQTEAVPFAYEKISVTPSGKRVAVSFRERSCKSGECPEVDAGMWGMDGGIPRFVTGVFVVSIDGREFVIPRKFYQDLTNTYRLRIFEKNARIVIELKGGEGAGAYTARFKLGGMCGFEREVCAEVCKEIWERTTWYNAFAYAADPRCESGIQ